MPIAKNRPFMSVPAPTAAAAVPPPASTASAANWADPPNTIAEVTTTCSVENPACRASTPDDSDSTKLTTAYGTPSRTPRVNDDRRVHARRRRSGNRRGSSMVG